MAGMGYSQAGNHDFHTQFVGGKLRIDDFAMSHHLDKDSYTHFPSPHGFPFRFGFSVEVLEVLEVRLRSQFDPRLKRLGRLGLDSLDV